jgi:hypothetical protein
MRRAEIRPPTLGGKSGRKGVKGVKIGVKGVNFDAFLRISWSFFKL